MYSSAISLLALSAIALAKVTELNIGASILCSAAVV